MLRLLRLEFSGIGRFVDTQTVDFTQLSDLIQVDGRNNNTGGSSGSGKTTVFHALDYLLGINDVPVTVLQSRLTKSGIDVSGSFDWDGKALTIQRSKARGLAVTIDGVTTEGSSKLGEEKLDEILGMARDLFQPILHKRQDEGGFFLKFTPKQTHDFLINCLGLGDLKTKAETLEARLKELEDVKTTLTNTLSCQQAGLQAVRDALAAVGHAPENDVNPEALEGFRAAVAANRELLEAVKTTHIAESAALEARRPQPSTESFDWGRYKELEAEQMAVGGQKSTVLLAERDRQAAVKLRINQVEAEERERVGVINKEIEALGNKERDRQAAVRDQINGVHLAEVNRKAEINKQIDDLSNKERDRQAEANRQISTTQIDKFRAENQVKEAGVAKQQAIGVAEQIRAIRGQQCPTCRQAWIADAAKAKETQLLSDLKRLKEAIETGRLAEAIAASAVERLAQLRQDALPRRPEGLAELQQLLRNDAANALLAQLHQDVQPRQPEGLAELQQLLRNEASNALLAQLHQDAQPRQPEGLRELEDKSLRISGLMAEETKREETFRFKKTREEQLRVVEFAKIQTELQTRQRQEVEQIQGQLDVDSRSLQGLQNRLLVYADAKKRYDSNLAGLRKQESGYVKTIEDLTYNLGLQEREQILAAESRRAIKTFTSCSFDDALENIGEMATAIVRSSPNMATATIQLEGQKETKEGKIKEEVNAVLSCDGEIGIPIKSLSGGERRAADLAIDLSAIKFIEERKNQGCDIFIMDEPFNGLSAVEIEPILAMLKTSSIGKKIVVVSHDAVVKEMVSNRLVVTREGLTSKIEATISPRNCRP